MAQGIDWGTRKLLRAPDVGFLQRQLKKLQSHDTARIMGLGEYPWKPHLASHT